ncbi:uncharacterized protein LOC132543699 [Ylistrum balloti]|uniref:uncharacterized protein LOC132543699 n=1 Tax=Ylistrum balloti TaxID=509963 RepID=UPI002905C8C1|nr:uncharacterized protein LOC132543699 [Ylistrum balloti]
MVSLRSPLACLLLWINIFSTVVNGQGQMVDPPGRSSMWRLGFATPINFHDNRLNCGNRKQPLNFWSGNCGLCGDPRDQDPKENEAGGKFATGIISKNYKKGAVISIKIQKLSNSEGFFEFRLCENNDVTKRITRDCLKHLLVNPETGETRYPVSAPVQYIDVSAKLPSDVTCSQCVLQWRYRTGSADENCETCEQQEFYACSDIAITDNDIPARTKKDGDGIAPVLIGSQAPNHPASNRSSLAECVSIFPGVSTIWCERNCRHHPTHCPAYMCQCIGTSSTTDPSPTTTTPTTTPTSATSDTPTTPEPTTTPTSATSPKTTTSFTTTTNPTTSTSTTSTTSPTSTAPLNTKARRCVSIYDSVDDGWCDLNCNHIPTFCPRHMCKCITVPITTPTTASTTTTTPTTTTTTKPTTTTTTTPTTTTTALPTTSYFD